MIQGILAGQETAFSRERVSCWAPKQPPVIFSCLPCIAETHHFCSRLHTYGLSLHLFCRISMRYLMCFRRKPRHECWRYASSSRVTRMHGPGTHARTSQTDYWPMTYGDSAKATAWRQIPSSMQFGCDVETSTVPVHTRTPSIVPSTPFDAFDGSRCISEPADTRQLEENVKIAHQHQSNSLLRGIRTPFPASSMLSWKPIHKRTGVGGCILCMMPRFYRASVPMCPPRCSDLFPFAPAQTAVWIRDIAHAARVARRCVGYQLHAQSATGVRCGQR